MTIFDYISDILFTKKKNLKTVEDEQEFSPFLVNRWISMYSKEMVPNCNIINKYLSVFESKKELYSMFIALFDKVPFKKINYFKKQKAEKTELEESVKLLARAKELSQREVLEYIQALQTDKG